MKKTLFVVLSFCFSSILFAQKVSFGIKAGVNAASVSNLGESIQEIISTPGFPTTGISFTHRSYFGFHGGAFVNIKLAKGFAIQPEVLYSMQGKGFKISEVSSGQSATMNFKLNYINIPVLAQYHLSSGLYFEAGPQLGILTSAKFKVKQGGDSNTEDAKDGISSTDIAIAAGIGYQLKSLPLGIYLRYNIGLKDIAQDNDTDKTYKNSVFQLGVSFRLAKK